MKYTKEIADKIIELYATGDHSVLAICEAVKIERSTFYEWKKNKTFAKRLADAHKLRLASIGELAVSALNLLLTKHEYEETTIEYTSGKDDKPKIKSKKVVKKFIMPNPSMVALALTNRLPDEWKNKQDVSVEHDMKNITVIIE